MNRHVITAIFVAIALTEAMLLFTDTGPDIGLVAVVVAVACLAIWFPRSMGSLVARPTPSPVRPELNTAFPDMRTTRLRQALAAGDTDSHHADRVRRQLIAIVDDELTNVHAIDRASEPDRARALLGNDLDRFVSDPDANEPLTLHGLAHIVTLIERL